MTRWEYQLVVIDFTSSKANLDTTREELNNSGREGWELVTLLPKMGANESLTIALFKREKGMSNLNP